MPAGAASLPKIVWFLWFQGLDEAPYVVRKCHESWVARNPGWQVVTLDENSLADVSTVDYASGNLAAMSPAHRAGLLRLDLLTHHGGVWADATCLCTRPLDDWLPQHMESGFFAFRRPGADRVLSSWFLAAEPGNVLVSRLFGRMLPYWDGHLFRNSERAFAVKAVNRLLRASARTRGWWFSPPVADWLRVHPYFAISYAFEKLIRDDPACAEAWARTPNVSAGPAHRPYRAGLLSPLSEEMRSELDNRGAPVYKTNWRLGDGAIPSTSVLGYLLTRSPADSASP